MRTRPWLVILLAACADPASPIEDLRVSTAVTPSVFRTGERANVTTTVTNVGRRSWTFGAETLCGDLFEARRPDGTVIRSIGIGCARATIATIEPGQRQEYTEEFWNNLVPGTYHVRSRILADVHSEWVTVVITP